MNVIQEEILLPVVQSEYLVAIPPVFDTYMSLSDRPPDQIIPIIVLVYRFDRREQYGFVYKFVGAKVR